MALEMAPANAGPNDVAIRVDSYVAALTAFDSQWSRSDRAMIETVPEVIPPGSVHAVPARRASANPVFLTNWRTVVPALCDVTARVLLPRMFDAESADACPRCVEIVRGWPTRPR